MEKHIILEKVIKARNQRLLNNCYSMDAVEHFTDLWQKDEEFVFSWEDHGIYRLTFFIKDWRSLNMLIQQIGNGKYYFEFMTKDPQEFIPDTAEHIASMMRLANADCRGIFDLDSIVLHYIDHQIGEKAFIEDAKEIKDFLWKTFHTEISHLLIEDEIKERIDQFSIHRTENIIDAILQTEVMPKKFYINQIVNKGEKKNIHAMLLNRLETYVNSGGKYLYAWVEDKNIASQKFHSKYGMKHDGMWNMVYCLER